MKKNTMEQDATKTGNLNAAEVIERFMETRESYIHALETTIQALKNKIDFHEQSENTIKRSLDELIAVQRLGNAISVASDAVSVFDSLLDLTRQVIPVEESMIFEVESSRSHVVPFIPACTDYMMKACQHLLEEGILDWVLQQKKTTVAPDLNASVGEIGERNFVVVPLVLRSETIGVYVIRTAKVRRTFSDHEVTLLGVLANEAAVAIENLKNVEKLRNSAEELKKSQSQMVHAAKLASLGELAGGIAHEINNPLQILLGHVSLLAQGKDVEHRIEIIRSQVQRIAQITKQLVSFSRSVPDELDHQPLSVNWAIKEIIDLVDYQFKNKGIEFDLRLSEEVPALDSNKNYLQQGFLNLLLNAKDAMPNGGKMLVSTEYTDGKIVIRFSDTGTGIKKEDLPKIFEPFFTTKEPGKGTGLGLPITRGIVRKLGGEIKVESVEGHGTTFTTSLPVRQNLHSRNGSVR